ncbi:hypothetical protein I6A60_35020 [Frankia sp. AgB1.9]|uniref:hypothetical protein n=1 Tax=unclassified Frankia TaxID=2632575 RepID=UPI00193385C3|nr:MULTISPECIES: hypothetical protein [unclassified Frankia]MBL7493689.1 hypothetical protein [Frankia sp. AgW1.1]MBL7553026.1 hypothetical protein [Frankia sp. AgB1.9]MBL7621581.1 hypothetical protein [Frankia sp. AgB1.8]
MDYASSHLVPDAARACFGSVLGVNAAVFYELDEQEDARRERDSAAAITDVDVLDLLLCLPIGESVRIDDLGGRRRRALAKIPTGCVEFGWDTVIRQARPPLTPSLAIVGGNGSFRRKLELAGRFAPFCPKAIVIDRAPRDLTAACFDADFYGVGLIVASGGSDVEALVAPQVHWPRRVVPRTWWFTEEIYRMHLTCGAPERT